VSYHFAGGERPDHVSLLNKIKSLATSNQEIIDRINKQEIIIKSYDIAVYPVYEEGQIRLEYEDVKIQSNLTDFLSQTQWPSELVQSNDIFNDKIDFNCTSFEDCVRLNKLMFPVSQKFRMFGGSEESVAELTNFLANFEIIQKHLIKVEQSIIDEPMPTNHGVQEQLDQINYLFSSMKSTIPGVKFYKSKDSVQYGTSSNWGWSCCGIQTRIEGKKVIATGSGYSCAIGDTLVSSFKIKVVLGGSDYWRIGVGVATNTSELNTYLSSESNESICYYSFGGIRSKSGDGGNNPFSTYTTGDVIMVRINKQDNTIQFYKGEQLVSQEVIKLNNKEYLYPAVHFNTAGDILEIV